MRARIRVDMVKRRWRHFCSHLQWGRCRLRGLRFVPSHPCARKRRKDGATCGGADALVRTEVLLYHPCARKMSKDWAQTLYGTE
jgi:L-rhamnose isomerase